jgi:iron complex outermembrane receptor protein
MTELTGIIVGRVTDAATGQGIQDAIVGVRGGATATGVETDARGAYRIMQLPVGSYTVEVSVLGYASQSTTVPVEIGRTATCDFKLQAKPHGS